MSNLKFGQPGADPQAPDTSMSPGAAQKQEKLAEKNLTNVHTDSGDAAGKANTALEEIRHAGHPKDDDPILFTCHPTQTLNLGPWHFRNSQLLLANESEAGEFEKFLRQQPAYLQHQVKRIDRASAEARFEELVRGKRVQGVDTTANTFGPSGVQQA